jgi:geranylgeranyl reductase family protein
MHHYDVIVAGGGPAGSTVARECSAQGLSVVLLDKAEFPRDKPCGGGVTERALRLLPFGIEPVVERTIHGVRFTVGKTAIARSSSEPLTFLTQRRLLDAYLLEKARLAGTRVHERTPVTSVEQTDSGYLVTAGGTRFASTVLVAADGANGVTARLAGIDIPRWKGIAFEGNVTVSGELPQAWRDTVGVDFTNIKGGYGWLFPKGDHVNIGVGGWRGVGPTLRTRLDILTRQYGYDPADLWNLRGHPLPVRRPGSPIMGKNILLIGDAAGFLDPFTGEGIYAAIWSGKAAAARILEYNAGNVDALTQYQFDVDRGLSNDLRVSRKLYDLFHLCPWIWTQGLRSARIWDLACRLLRGDQTYSGVSEGSGWVSSVLSGTHGGIGKVSQRLSGRDIPLLDRRLFFST